MSNLLGGNEEGHYHLTREQWEELKKLIENPTPQPPAPEPEPDEWTDYDGGFAATSESEYAENAAYWLNGGSSRPEQANEIEGGVARW